MTNKLAKESMCMVASAALALSLFGCNVTVSESTDGATDGSAEQQSTAESHHERLAGTWKLVETNGSQGEASAHNAETLGMSWTLALNDDGTAVMTTYQNDEAASSDSGTWEVAEDGSATMTFDGTVSTLTLDDDGKMIAASPDGSTTVTFAPATDTDIASKTQDMIDSIEEIVNENASIALGEPVKADNYEFTLDKAELLDEIYPPDTSGFYNYYQDEKGSTYYVVTGTFKNLGGRICRHSVWHRGIVHD